MAKAAKAESAGVMQNPFSGRKMGPKVLESIQLKRSLDGGYQASHHHTNYDHPPEHHQFDKGASKKFLDHIVQHMGIEMAEEKGEKKDSKAVKAEKHEAAQRQGET